MNILFSITYYAPYVSGLTIYVKRMAEALVKRSHNVTIICMRHDATLPEEEVINGVKVIRCNPFLTLNKGFLSWEFTKKSWQLAREYDVTIVSLPQFEGFIPALFARISGNQVMSIYHCEIDLPKSLVNDVIQVFLEVSNFTSLLLSNKILAYTADYASNSRLLKPLFHRIIFQYPPVIKPSIKLNVRKMLDQKIGQRDITLGISARLAKEKGIEYLINALPEIRKSLGSGKIKIAIAGPTDPVGEADYKAYIMELVSRYKSSIVFLGTLTQDEIGSFYSLIDILVLPSVNSTEAFGMVQVEAMLLGTPVIASNLPGVRVPVTKTGMGLLVPPGDSHRIARAVVEIIRTPSKFRAPGGKAAREFSFDKSVDNFESLL